jgi:condensin complex subunit 1
MAAFPIPSALHDLERAPYNLLPYPEDFDDDDEAARAESFDALVIKIETSNRTVVSSTMVLFESEEEDEEAWNDEERMQALYTLVR